MRRGRVLPLPLFTIIIVLTIFFSISASAGNAGVGVLNVSPKFGIIRVVQQDNFIRIYLNISDYNSWEDIYIVNVSLENYGTESAEFLFKQYSNTESYEKLNEFSEISGEKNLLVKEKCSFYHSAGTETVADRCNLELLFVFHTTGFTLLNILASDLEGLTTQAHIDYNADEAMRSIDVIIVPGLNIPIIIPPYFLDLIAVILGIIGTIYFIKELNKRNKNKKSAS